MKLNWIVKKFEALTPYELYNIMWLRNEVFVVEQNCVYQDADYKDQKGWHLMGVDEEGKLMAYVRLLPVGVSYENEPSIGRVVTNPAARGTGVGRELMQIAIQQCEELFGKTDIKIGAQYYLYKFYSSLGFEQTSDIYLEDGIEHIEMIRFFKNE
ncbi:GNAT family N-acetyltransferase [Lacibacter sp.]|uniref:GNAT family N-acetyltransferase n=1 Tax=Lacibacter sp. TaxID=1915409 RepID=UPI002B4B6DEC|nr:GNAT family N-acetyltransferase [Lacibacter sp.]HLP37506.1 GNAT family N-acetyltransferase [Lacibacter sp.]